MKNERLKQIVSSIVSAQGHLMCDEFGVDRIEEYLTEALKFYDEEKDAVSSVLSSIARQHEDSAKEAGDAMHRAAMLNLYGSKN